MANASPVAALLPRLTFTRESLPIWLAFLLGVAVAAKLGGMVRQVLSPQDALRGTRSIPAIPSRPLSALVNIASITAVNLFGANAADSRPIGVSTSRLALTGTFSTSNPSTGYAILRNSDGQHSVHAAGTQIPDAGFLREIYPKYVVLEVEGRREAIFISEQAREEFMAAQSSLAAAGPNGQSWQGAPIAETPEIPEGPNPTVLYTFDESSVPQE